LPSSSAGVVSSKRSMREISTLSMPQRTGASRAATGGTLTSVRRRA
jgi:hypothetical protein